MSESPKYLTDNTLAKLAKWLRLLGYDTAVFPRKAGREMLRRADAEDRIVLTRRQDMTERQFCGRLFLITDIDVGNQLNNVIGKYSLKINRQKTEMGMMAYELRGVQIEVVLPVEGQA